MREETDKSDKVAAGTGRKAAGIYVHVPFCERLCPYCDFAVSVKVDIPHEQYAGALVEELRRRKEEIVDHEVRTVYFGGGTPSLLAPSALESVLREIDRRFDLATVEEITLEANPNQVTSENLAAWRALGITRLSIGCQSFQERHLKALRRNHDAALAKRAVSAALKEMDEVSLDLMFGGPGQTEEEWALDLREMQRFAREEGLTHVSAYNLTIEEGTAFWIRRKRGSLVVPGEDQAAQMLEALTAAAEEVGLRRYEVSNYARPGHESRHNSSYWRGVPYLGVGVGAHSLELYKEGCVIRRANPKRYQDYMKSPGVPADWDRLSAEEHLAERLFLGARSLYGVDLQELRTQFQDTSPAHFGRIERVLEDLVERGFMARDGERFFPTTRGLNFSDSLAAWLFEAAHDTSSA